MKRIAVVLVVLVVLASSAFASSALEEGFSLLSQTKSTTLYGGYLGALTQGKEMTNSVGAGAQYKTHLFSLPLFYYVDSYFGYPFTRPPLPEGTGSFAIDMSFSMGLGWRFFLSERFALALGAGASLYFLVDITSKATQWDSSFGVEVLTEMQYAFNDWMYLSVMFNPCFDVLQMMLSTEGSVGGVRFRPQGRVGVGVLFGKPLSV